MKTLARRLLLLICGMLLAAGGACGWHYYHPPIYEAKARLSLTEESLLAPLQHSELMRRARRTLRDKWTAQELAGEKGLQPQVRGTLETKYSAADKSADVSYQTIDQCHAVEELTTLIELFRTDHKADQEAHALLMRKREQEELHTEQNQIQGALDRDTNREGDLKTSLHSQEARDAQQSITLEGIRSLSKALAFAKLSRIETDQHIALVRKELDRGETLGTITSKLPEGQIRELLQNLIQQQQVHTELGQTRAMLQDVSKLYGKKHPRRKELESRIELLSAQESSAQLSTHFKADGALAQYAPLLKTLVEIQQQTHQYERELQKQFDLERESQESHQRLQTELRTLQEKIGTSQKRQKEIEIRLAELEKTPQGPSISIEQLPWLVPEPVSMTLKMLLLCSLAPGVLLGLILNGFWVELPKRRIEQRQVIAAALPSLQQRRMMRQLKLQEARTS